ncbi:MAG: hypothetical protein R3E50_17190 [Halioglobus sp.]
MHIEDLLQIVESAEAERFVGALFRRKFGSAPPDFPRHFLALYSPDGSTWQAVGYVNYWQRQAAFMAGGLVIEDRAYRTMPSQHRALIRSAGGIAERLMASSLRMLPANDVVWAYVGDTRSGRVLGRVGYEHTQVERIMAYWTRHCSSDEKRRLAEEITAVGPF